MTPAFIAKAEDAEKCVLSALRMSLLQVGSLATSLELKAHHFCHEVRRKTFEHLMLIWADGKTCDTFVLVNRLRDAGLDEAQTQHAIDCLHHSGTAHGAADHIGTLLACHASRRAWEIGQRLVSHAYDGASGDVAGLLEAARSDLESIVVEPEPEQTSLRTHIARALQEMNAAESEENAIEFGIGLDETAGPFLRGDLIVIAGATGGGKSALAGNIIENVASEGFKAALFGLEMTGAQYAERMLASQGRVNVRDYKLSRRRMNDRTKITQQQDWQLSSMERVAAYMKDWPVHIVTKAHSLAQCTAKARQIHANGGLDVAVFDYAQLLEGIQGDSREREVASISRGLKRNAMDLGTINILLSQLNDDGRLRESRALGQDANTVLFIDGDSSLIRVGKARSAPAGAEIKVNFKREVTRFEAA